MRWDPDGPTVVLSPHPDDAVLSAWTVLTGPGEVRVLTVCSGLPPAGTLGAFDPLFGVTDSAAFMALRAAEDAEALARAGRRATGLGFLDHQYRSEPPAVGELVAAVEGAVGSAARVLAPAAIGDHPDHQLVRRAALELAVGSAVPLTLYADLPYAARLGWPAWVSGEPARPYLEPDVLWRPALASLPTSGPPPRPVALDPGQVAAKETAIRTYRTQFEALNAGPVGLLTASGILGFELYWDVASAGPSR
jgi:LmbE family N-acetylglucosaminyl deacetylase